MPQRTRPKARSRCINDAGVQPDNGSKGMSNSLTIAAIWVGLPFFMGMRGPMSPGGLFWCVLGLDRACVFLLFFAGLSGACLSPVGYRR